MGDHNLKRDGSEIRLYGLDLLRGVLPRCYRISNCER